MEILNSVRDTVEKKILHFKDPLFFFDPDSHTYTYDGEKFDSVTTFLKGFKDPFNTDYWSQKKAEERGITQEEILKEWKNKADTATGLGTEVHEWIEDFLSGRNPELPQNIESKNRCSRFFEFYNKNLTDFIPLESELRVFSKKWRIAGTIDQPFLFYDKKLDKVLTVIGDWKTNKVFKDDNHSKGRYKKLLRPFNNLWENHHNEYSIQISLYRLILEEAGISTHSGFLCHIGPDSPIKLYPAKDLRESLRFYLDQNRLYS